MIYLKYFAGCLLIAIGLAPVVISFAIKHGIKDAIIGIVISIVLSGFIVAGMFLLFQ